MSYINMVGLSYTEEELGNFLVSQDVMKETVDRNGDTIYAGILPGMEWMIVPNPIVTDPGSGGARDDPNYIPPTMDTRLAHLVKFAGESLEAQINGPQFEEGLDENGKPIPIPPLTWSKLGQWITANSTIIQGPPEWTIYGKPFTGDIYKINAQNVWLIQDEPERFGVWQ